jgi:hypothetical protein
MTRPLMPRVIRANAMANDWDAATAMTAPTSEIAPIFATCFMLIGPIVFVIKIGRQVRCRALSLVA